ncbi:CII family transcriptional regulator [Pseudomonas sp. zbq_18]|uniref:CII family transcriptional regulator n=1 Tax=Pseudomonas sp. zbq_18 TaxID=3367251 RepID=UPI00370A8DFB
MSQRELASKNEAAILRALAGVGQKRVAEGLGISESAVSRMKSGGELAKTAELLAALGLELHEVGSLHMRKEVAESLRVLAALGLELSPELMTEKK